MKPIKSTTVTLFRSIVVLLALLMLGWGLAPAAQANEVEIGCTVDELVNNLNFANEYPDEDTLILPIGCVFELSYPTPGIHTFLSISNDLIIEGNGATILRSSNPKNQSFRIMAISNGAKVTLRNLKFVNGYWPSDGGGAILVADADLTLDHVTFKGNQAMFGGAVAALGGQITIHGSRFERNSALTAVGGGLFTSVPTKFLFNTTSTTFFIDNKAKTSGGGIYSKAELMVSNGSFENNQAVDGNGGAIFVDGPLVLNRSKFIRNRAAEGLGLYLRQPDTPSQLINNLWADNFLTAADEGSAVITVRSGVADPAALTIAHNTISGADSAKYQAGGVFLSGVPATLRNNIITNHFIGVNNFESQGFITAEHNLYFANAINESGDNITSSNNLEAYPFFANPANGDFHLRSVSPAIDAGVDVGVTRDFDFRLRPCGAGYDIGAYEFRLLGCTPPPPDPDPGVGSRVYLPLVVK
jgi:predicted outer membrane repeat protein